MNAGSDDAVMWEVSLVATDPETAPSFGFMAENMIQIFFSGVGVADKRCSNWLIMLLDV